MIKEKETHVDTRTPHGKKTRAYGVQVGFLGPGNESGMGKGLG